MHSNPVPRRRHSAELKAKVLAACSEPGTSIAAVALSPGLNANLVRKWLVGRGLKRTGIQAPVTVMASAAATVPPPAAAPLLAADVRFLPIELDTPAPGHARRARAPDRHTTRVIQEPGSPGNPYDGHVLSARLDQTDNLLQDPGRSAKQVIVDLGYRGVDADNPGVQIIHRGRCKSLSDHVKRLLKQCHTIEPLICHNKADHWIDRCWLQGAVGDGLHALCCAAGYNIRWLRRAWIRRPASVFEYQMVDARFRALASANHVAQATCARVSKPESCCRIQLTQRKRGP